MVTGSMMAVQTSTVNMMGFFIICRGSSFTKECLTLSMTCSLWNRDELLLLLIISYSYNVKCSAMVLNACTGKNDRAATMKMTANVITPNVPVSVLSVPALSGMYFFFARMPAIAT